MYLFLLLLTASFTACEEQQLANKYPNPQWTFTPKPEYSVSMTAAVRLPDNLNPYISDNDLMAAVAGDEVRAVANLYEGVFYLNIQGTTDEVTDITFLYWSANTMYMYRADEVFPFRENDMLGTPDKPLVLTFKAI